MAVRLAGDEGFAERLPVPVGRGTYRGPDFFQARGRGVCHLGTRDMQRTQQR